MTSCFLKWRQDVLFLLPSGLIHEYLLILGSNRLAMLLFFDLSSGEIFLIVFVAFIVLGPKRIPEVARTIGKTMNEMKRASSGFKEEINKEVQRLDRETRLSEYLNEKQIVSENKPLSPETEVQELEKETMSNKKNRPLPPDVVQ